MVEGFRLAMAGNFDDKGYAFIGSQLGRLLGASVQVSYYHSVIWYVHFVVTGLFVAYLPFGRMLHFVLAPLSLALGAARRRAGADKEDKR
jgi:nitrate reductase gamma subunit